MAAWRLYLVVWALSFIGFGAAFIAYPADMSRLVSIVLIDATAVTDVRATYGGLEFGVGVFFLACAMRRDFVRIGLFCAACVLVGMGTARFVGLLLDGFWQPLELLITAMHDRRNWFGAKRGSISFHVVLHAVTPVLAYPPEWRPR